MMASGVSGTWSNATPVACSTALRMAGAGPSIGNSPMPFAPPGPPAYGFSKKWRRMGGGVGGRGRDDLFRPLPVPHPPVAPHDVLIQRPTDALRHAALDLPGREHGVDDSPHLLHGDEVLDARLIRQGIHGHLRDVDGPGVRAVGVAAVVLVVPLDVRGLLVLHVRLEHPVF